MNDIETAKLLLEVIPRTMRIVRTEIRQIAGGEFTTPQYRLLAKLSREPSTNQELALWMGVSAPSISKMIDKLASRGLVARGAGSDRRQISIRATPKGAAQVEEVRGIVQKVFAARLAALPAGKKQELMSGLKVLKEIFL
jgi:DNA-binding MarR family transcriptional regulator